MNFLTGFQADRLISQISEEADPTSPGAKKAFEKLGKLGTAAVPKILEALSAADPRQTAEYVELLAKLTSDKTLAAIIRGLADSDPRTVKGTAAALVEQPQIQRQPARRFARRGSVLEGRDRRGAHGPQGSVESPPAAEPGLRSPARRKGGGFQTHRRDRYRGSLARSPFAHGRQRPRCEDAHHQRANPLRHAAGPQSPARAAQGPEQARSQSRADRASRN